MTESQFTQAHNDHLDPDKHANVEHDIDELQAQITALQAARDAAVQAKFAQRKTELEASMRAHLEISKDEHDIIHPDIVYVRIWREVPVDALFDSNERLLVTTGGMTYAVSRSLRKVVGQTGGGLWVLLPSEELWYKHDRPQHSWLTARDKVPANQRRLQDEADQLMRDFIATL